MMHANQNNNFINLIAFIAGSGAVSLINVRVKNQRCRNQKAFTRWFRSCEYSILLV